MSFPAPLLALRLQRARHSPLPPPAAPAPADLAAASTQFGLTLSHVWRSCRCCPASKEPLWRLAVHGIFGSHIPGPCACGAPVPPDTATSPCRKRLHQFWECPVAQHVLGEVCAVVGPVSVAQIWLLTAAPEGVHGLVWQLVGLAAVLAMERGRACLHGLQIQLPDGPSAAREQAVARAGVAAADSFWAELQSFAAVPPKAWPEGSFDGLQPGGAFLSWRDGTLACDGPRA